MKHISLRLLSLFILCTSHPTLPMENYAEESIKKENTEKLFEALMFGQHDEMKKCLEDNVDVHAREPYNSQGNTLLITAARSKKMDYLCKALIAKGADVNAKNIYGETALILAAERGNSSICALLLKAGADPFVHNISGETALSSASTYFYKFHSSPIRHPFNDGMRGSREDRARRVREDYQEYKKTCTLLATCYTKQKKNVVTLLACLKHHEHDAGKTLYWFTKHLLRPYLQYGTIKTMRKQMIEHGQRVLGYFEIDWVIKQLEISLS